MRTQPVTGAPAGPLLRRLGWCASFVLLLVLLPQFTDDDGVKGVIPGFLALIFLQLAPIILVERADLFSPPVYAGAMSAFATIAQLAYFITLDRVDIRLVGGLTPDEIEALASKTLWASSLGLLAFYAGYYPHWGKRWKRLFPRYSGTGWDRTRLLIVAIVLMAMWAVSYAIFQLRVGVPLLEFTNLKAGKEVWRDDPTLSWMLRGIQLGVLPLLLYLALAASRRRDRHVIFYMGGLLVMGMLMLRVGQRGFLFLPLLGGLIIVHYLRKRIPVWAFAAALILGTSMNSLMLQWRTGYDTGGPESLSAVAEAPGTTLASHEDDRQRFGAMAVVIHHFPERKDYLLGESWLGLLAQPIPRWLWPEKNKYFMWRDTKIVENITGAAIPSTYLTTLYANFSWIGIVLGMFLWGLLQRGLYEWLLQNLRDPGAVIFYAMMLLFFGLTMIQIASAVQYVLLTWIATRWLLPNPASAKTES